MHVSKLAQNKARDREVSGTMKKSRWKVMRIRHPTVGNEFPHANFQLEVNQNPGQVCAMNVTTGYIICVDALCEGEVPLVKNQAGDPVIFISEREAQLEIVDTATTRLQEFVDGERKFEDAISVEEFIQQVEVLPDGSWRPALAS